MLEYKGKYGTAKVMLDTFEDEQAKKTISQIYEFLNHPAFTNPISLMPDLHVGKGTVIGFTMEMLPDKMIPNIVGVDINCAMFAMNVGKSLLKRFSREALDLRIRSRVPFSQNVHDHFPGIDGGFWDAASEAHRTFTMKFNKKFKTSYSPMTFNIDWLKSKCEEINMDYDRTIKSIGTLGGGNHFIEFGESQKSKDNWFTIHSGSRQYGVKIADYWQRKAGKGNLAYLTGDNVFGYLSDVVFTQHYAELNRLHMASHILEACELEWSDVSEIIKTSHNFIDFDDFIIRKGAIRSYIGEKMIIPFNMEDGIIICEGKSNPEWNYSAPHGAGRVDSRRWAKENLNLDEAKERMFEKGIYCSTMPLDETKLAYKDPKIIEDAIEPTAKIIDRLKPLFVCKGK